MVSGIKLSEYGLKAARRAPQFSKCALATRFLAQLKIRPEKFTINTRIRA